MKKTRKYDRLTIPVRHDKIYSKIVILIKNTENKKRMNKLMGAAVVGQSGGPTAAINATLAGVIKEALSNQYGTDSGAGVITKLYGMRNGIEGFLEKNLVDLSECFTSGGKANNQKIADLCNTPAAALGSCRKKLPDPAKDAEFYENLISIFKEFDIRYFFYIGGNDSMDTVAKLSSYLKNHEYEMRIVGLPKTIDNDLAGTDHAPGYGSAAKYIATTMQEITRDCAVYRIPAVTIVEIMGRDAGWLTAAAALPKLISGYGPDLVYLPERTFSMKAFVADVNAELEKKPNVVIAVSEGIKLSNGTYVGEGNQSGIVDVFGHRYLSGTGKTLERTIKKEIGCKVRSVELSIPQRCASHISSLTDIEESFNVGQAGFEAAMIGATGCMMSIIRTIESGFDNSYGVSYETLDISKIANTIKYVPAEFINRRGNNVTNECLEYIKPLILGEPQIKMVDGLPYHVVI